MAADSKTRLLASAIDAEDQIEIEALEAFAAEFRACPVCPEGEGESLGLLGNRHHFACRQCGMQFSKAVG